MGLEEEIEQLEQEIAETPYNKATEEHIGRLKAKLAEKKEELAQRQQGGGSGSGYAVEQHGDATVALVGFPSVGKSSLLNALTNAESEVGEYDFTTLDVQPGMLDYRGANIQLLDVPGLIEGAAAGRGDGQQVLSVVRTADLIVFVVSPFEPDQYDRLLTELEQNKVRVDEQPPAITVHEREKGGIDITATDDFTLDKETVKTVLREHGVANADVRIHEPLNVDQLIDGVQDNRAYIPSMVAVNKMDLVDRDYLSTVEEGLRNHDIDPDRAVYISAEEQKGLDALKDRIWDELDLMRVYMDKPGRGVDYDEPLILPTGATVDDAIEKLGGDFDDRFRFARVTGSSAAHEKQRVGRDHELADEDVLQLALRR